MDIARVTSRRGRAGDLVATCARVAVRWAWAPALITLAAWTPFGQQPGPGIDPSWIASLMMAAHRGLTFGSQVVFTYGPLGFLDWGQFWQPHLAQIAYAFDLVLWFAMAFAAFHAIKPATGTVGALVVSAITIYVAGGNGQTIFPFALPLIGASYVLRPERSSVRTTAIALALLGAFASIEFLVKVSVGITMIPFMLVIALVAPGRTAKNCLIAAGACLTTLLILWAACGQAFSALPAYIRYAVDISGGYSAAMGSTDPTLYWQTAIAVVVLPAGMFAAWHTTSGWTTRARGALVVLWAIIWFSAFKEGFVRHDAPHSLSFFSTALLALFAVPVKRESRATAIVSVAGAVLVTFAVQGAVGGPKVFNPVSNVSAFFTQLSDNADLSRAARIQDAGRTTIRTVEPVAPQALSTIGHKSVAVYPTEQAQAWAYSMNWDPMPLLQAYQAYTSALDALDATFIRSAAAPKRILFAGTISIDGRVGAFDDGATLRAILCHYSSTRTYQTTADPAVGRYALTYTVLVRARNRCTTKPERLSVVHAAWGEEVHVPQPPHPNALVYVRIFGTDSSSPIEDVESLLYKPTERYINVNGAGPARLISGTATDGLPLELAKGDFQAPLNIAVGAKTLAVTKGAGPQPAGRPITYVFFSQTVS